MESNDQVKKINFIKRRDWLILVAVLLVIAAIAIWSFFGILQMTAETVGVSFRDPEDDQIYIAAIVDSDVIHLVEPESTLVRIIPDWASKNENSDIYGTVTQIVSTPLSADDLNRISGDDIGDLLLPDGKRGYVILIRPDKGEYEYPEGSFCDVTVILKEIHPADMFINGRQ